MAADEQRGGWVDPWARKHAKQAIVVRALLAPWILFVTVFLCVKGYWWGLVFLPFLALDPKPRTPLRHGIGSSRRLSALMR